jgi:hypothetical protein
VTSKTPLNRLGSFSIQIYDDRGVDHLVLEIAEAGLDVTHFLQQRLAVRFVNMSERVQSKRGQRGNSVSKRLAANVLASRPRGLATTSKIPWGGPWVMST